MSVTFDPGQPPGTQLLNQGDDRIRDLNRNLVVMFGGTGIPGAFTFGAPFSFDATGNAQASGRVSVVSDPVGALEIVPKQYADSKVIVSTDVNTTDGINYTGTAASAINTNTGTYWTYLYLVTNAGQANTSTTPTLRFGSGPFALIKNLSGGPLVVGEFITGMSLLAFDGTAFRLISAQPDLGSIIGLPQRTVMTTNVALALNTPTTIMGTGSVNTIPAVTTPSVGNWLIYVEYYIYANVPLSPSAAVYETWVNDGTGRVWAPCRQIGISQIPATIEYACAGSGVSPVAYPPATGIDVQIQGITNTASVVAVPNSTQTGTLVPKSYLSVTFMRSQ